MILTIDGGGTGTKYFLQKKNGKQLLEFSGSSTNFKSVGVEVVLNNFIKARETIFNNGYKNSEIEYYIFGLSGLDTDSDYEIFTNIIKNAGFDLNKCVLVNDAVLAFYANEIPPGIIAIAGTGSIAISLNSDGSTCRFGGWGYDISDEGSGYWYGMEVIKACIKHYDKMIKTSNLYKKVCDHLDATNETIISILTERKEPYEIAALAPILFESASENDEISQQIVLTGVNKLIELIDYAYHQINEEESVGLVLSGGLFSNKYFLDIFNQELNKNPTLKTLEYKENNNNPVLGGLEIIRKDFDKWKVK